MEMNPRSAFQFDLGINCDTFADGLRVICKYNTDLFDAATIRRWLGHFRTLLEAALADATQPLTRMPLLREEAREALPAAGSQTAYPRDAAIHELFEVETRRAPAAIALVAGDNQLSYDTLNRRANQLAHRLRQLGSRRDTPVGVCMERSPELIVALLAILKAGGAYVPLDPATPAQRLALLLADTETPLVLTQTHLRDRLPATAKVLCLDAEAFEKDSDENLAPETKPDDLAYIIYTSGSTGTPKGVAVTHRNVVRLVRDTDYAAFSPDETFLQLAPVAFDASTFEIWGALLNGARLVLMPPTTPALEDIGTAIRTHGVTTLWLTSALFNAMVDERLSDLRPLRQLLAGGDTLSVAHVRKALAGLPDTRLINGYGPTESTTFACCHTITPENTHARSIPIGQPIANTTAYILDREMQPVPIGVPGELFLGGDGIARGYWRAPALTAEKFVADPFAAAKDARLYRTGDRARWLADRHDRVSRPPRRADQTPRLPH